jgi:hypothetical protein
MISPGALAAGVEDYMLGQLSGSAGRQSAHEAAADGVTDRWGRVHGHDNLLFAMARSTSPTAAGTRVHRVRARADDEEFLDLLPPRVACDALDPGATTRSLTARILRSPSARRFTS